MDLTTLVLALPLVGGALLALLPNAADALARPLAVLVAVATLGLSAVALVRYDPVAGGVQFLAQRPWAETAGLTFQVGVDGLGAVMAALAAVLFLVAVLVSDREVVGPRAYHAWLLVLEAATLGVFLARSWALFYACWELTLVPLFFLIGRWGGPGRERASLTLLLYTMGGSVFLLNGTLALYLLVPGGASLDLPTEQTGALPFGVQLALYVALLLGFAVKLPIVPLHGWLPLAHVEAPAPVSILLSGILLKLGAYGVLHANALLPGPARAAAPVLMWLGVVGVVYGALMAWRQTDLKALVAWSSVSHMGVVLAGIATLDEVGLGGAILQIVAHGLVAGLLFMAVGILYERSHTRELGDLAGLATAAPWLAGLAVFGLLASFAMPGTAGFAAELQVIAGVATRSWAAAAVLMLGALVWAGTAVRVVARLIPGPPSRAMAHVTDLHTAEAAAGLLLVVALVLVGLWPALITSRVDHDPSLGQPRTAAEAPPTVEVARVD